MEQRVIYTLGYGTASSAAVVADLAIRHQAVVVDTRLSARSRNPIWSRGALQRALGDRYVYAGDALGNLNYKNGGPIAIADMAAGADRVSALLHDPRGGHDIILLCVCAALEHCHRTVVAATLAAQLGAAIVHLRGDK